MKAALRQHGAVFIGVVLSPAEVKRLLDGRSRGDGACRTSPGRWSGGVSLAASSRRLAPVVDSWPTPAYRSVGRLNEERAMGLASRQRAPDLLDADAGGRSRRVSSRCRRALDAQVCSTTRMTGSAYAALRRAGVVGLLQTGWSHASSGLPPLRDAPNQHRFRFPTCCGGDDSLIARSRTDSPRICVSFGAERVASSAEAALRAAARLAETEGPIAGPSPCWAPAAGALARVSLKAMVDGMRRAFKEEPEAPIPRVVFAVPEPDRFELVKKRLDQLFVLR